jgi:Cu-Zn family superoxide dismutase
LIEDTRGVLVRVTLENAEPGLHGVHIHEVADCSAPDGSSAGPHFNPGKTDHGIPEESDEHHLGDLGNISVDEDTRTGVLEREVRFADLSETSDFSFMQRGLIVHADPDKGVQPSGDSGDRIACAELSEESAVVALETVH